MTDLNLKIKGFRDADLKQWEHTRFIAFTMAKPYLKNKGLTLQRFLPLPTDKDNPKGLEEQIKALADVNRTIQLAKHAGKSI